MANERKKICTTSLITRRVYNRLVLLRVGRNNRHSHALPVGIQNGTATLENCRRFLQLNPTLPYSQWTHFWMFIAALCIIHKLRKTSNNSNVYQVRNGQTKCRIRARVCTARRCSAVKRNRPLTARSAVDDLTHERGERGQTGGCALRGSAHGRSKIRWVIRGQEWRTRVDYRVAQGIFFGGGMLEISWVWMWLHNYTQ